jgi:hypothetical protein
MLIAAPRSQGAINPSDILFGDFNLPVARSRSRSSTPLDRNLLTD